MCVRMEKDNLEFVARECVGRWRALIGMYCFIWLGLGSGFGL